jgi:hypothetical protein
MSICLRRREFIAGVGSAAAAWPLAGRAQQGDRRIGVLMPGDENYSDSKRRLSAFTQALAGLGWTDGRNVRMDLRWYGDDIDRIGALARELVGLQPGIIATYGTPATAAGKGETRMIPIVFAGVAEPVARGFVARLDRPSENVTGFGSAEASLGGKWLQLLSEIAPGLIHVQSRVEDFGKKAGAVKIPKLGWIKLRWHRPLGGDITRVTLHRKGGHWYASINWKRQAIKPEPSNLPSIGIDRGVKVFAALSDGRHIAPINAGRKIADKLAKAQRRLARKTKYSANWRKQKAKISRLYARAANTRKDFLHKQSLAIAKSHGIVKIERLLVQNMTGSAKGTVDNPGRNVKAKSGLNRSILDQGWGMFAIMLGYKLSERGGELV